MAETIILQNKYILTRYIGEGSYSKVYEAKHLTKDHKVAVKFDIEHDEVSRQLMRNEINVYLYMLKHKINNMCNIKSFGIYEGRNYIILDLLYMDLEKYFNKHRPRTFKTDPENFPNTVAYLPQYKTIIELFMQCLAHVKNMHKKGLVHRDIKPDNFLLNKSNKLYIIDFGLSTKYDSDILNKNVVGSYLYCAPDVHKECYVYEYKHDIISIYYMFFKILSVKKLPWEDIPFTKESSKNIVYYYIKKDCDLLNYYKDEEIVLKFVNSYIHFVHYDRIEFYDM